MSAHTLPQVRGELRLDEPMAAHVSWRAGGRAALWFRPADVADLQDFLRDYQGPILPVGLGSNLLIRDGGWPGAVISLYDTLDSLEIHADGRVRAEAGVHCATLASRCSKAGIGGAVFMGGIPGTVGGALAMNAGAWGGETWERLQQISLLDAQGQLHSLPAADFEVGYRQVRAPVEGPLYLAAEWAFEPGCDAAELQQAVRQMLAERRARQPVGQPSCGSVFRNPEGSHAAALIEAAGLKGLRQGGAEVSTKHANFILNRDQASAADIESLLLEVQAQVQAHAGVRLHPEVRIVGEPQ